MKIQSASLHKFEATEVQDCISLNKGIFLGILRYVFGRIGNLIKSQNSLQNDSIKLHNDSVKLQNDSTNLQNNSVYFTRYFARACVILFTCALATSLIFALSGCGKDDKGQSQSQQSNANHTQSQTTADKNEKTHKTDKTETSQNKDNQNVQGATPKTSNENQGADAGKISIIAPKESVADRYKPATDPSNIVDILMDDGNHILIELKPEVAPLTVKNFQKLIGEGFYNGLTFHRVIDGFMIQGGDPLGTGAGGSKETIKGEFAKNGISNPLSHKRGTVSMARTQDPNSASSQFFICNGDSPFLDGEYAAFGEVIGGIEEVDKIAKLEKGAQDKPVHPPVMKQVAMVVPQ